MNEEDAVEFVQNLKDIRDEIIVLLNQANEIISAYDYGLKVSKEVYDLRRLNSDIEIIEKKEGLENDKKA